MVSELCFIAEFESMVTIPCAVFEIFAILNIRNQGRSILFLDALDAVTVQKDNPENVEK